MQTFQAVQRGEHAAPEPARIGPNAVLQTVAALAQVVGPRMQARVLALAGLSGPWVVDALVPEADFLRLVRAVRALLTTRESEAVLRIAGARTAEYVASHRIPRLVRWALWLLPVRVALPLLLRAFERHAWTFAGSGAFRVEGGRSPVLVLVGGPTCRAESGPGADRGAYYEEAFTGLVRLAAPSARVREAACAGTGSADACRFVVELAPRAHGEP